MGLIQRMKQNYLETTEKKTKQNKNQKQATSEIYRKVAEIATLKSLRHVDYESKL